ncbi:MAG: choice-of-anchor D domain-containing protein, partial [Ferruginibacter sp.]
GNNIGETTLIDEADKCNQFNGVLQNFNLNSTSSNWVSDSILTNSNCAATFPNIQVSGNNNCIINGDTSPEVADNTDFGNVTPSARCKTFTIINTGTASLNIGIISVSGTDNSMFTISSAPAASLAAGASTSFTVLFSPVGLGLKTANISIASDDTDENPYSFVIQGTSITSPLMISNVVATANVNGTSTITWATEVAATSVVNYGTDSLNLNLTQNNPALVTNHSIQLTGLTLGTTYYYRVTSVDALNNSETSPAVPASALSFSMPPLITLQPTSTSVCKAATVTLSSTAQSDVAFTVQWQISTDNGSNWLDSIGAINDSISFVASLIDNGKQFRAVWTNAGGANISNVATVTVNPTSSSTTNVTICSTALP